MLSMVKEDSYKSLRCLVFVLFAVRKLSLITLLGVRAGFVLLVSRCFVAELIMRTLYKLNCVLFDVLTQLLVTCILQNRKVFKQVFV